MLVERGDRSKRWPTAFRGSEPLDLAERLMLALEAGEAAGGDKRGRQSAAMRVHHAEEYCVARPARRRASPIRWRSCGGCYAIARLQLLPFVEGMPRRGAAARPRRRAWCRAARLPAAAIARAVAAARRDDMTRCSIRTETFSASTCRPNACRRCWPRLPRHPRARSSKLRELDLTDVHPAVVFEPTAPYRTRAASAMSADCGRSRSRRSRRRFAPVSSRRSR